MLNKNKLLNTRDVKQSTHVLNKNTRAVKQVHTLNKNTRAVKQEHTCCYTRAVKQEHTCC